MTNCLSSQPTTYYKTNNKCTVLHSLVLAYIRIFRSVFTAFGDEVLFCTRQFSSKSRVNCVKISCSTIHQLARALLVISGCGVQSLKTIHREMGQTYLIFVIFFTRAKFLENKIYTEKARKLRQNTQKIANFCVITAKYTVNCQFFALNL